MKVKELRQILSHANDDETVCIPVFRVGGVGGRAFVEVKSTYSGFDWDNGKFFLNGSEELREIDRNEIETLLEKYEELSWKKSQIDKIKRENKMLKEQLAKLQA